MKIQSVVFSAGRTGFFFDDQAAVKAGLPRDGFWYQGHPVTDGFKSVRQAGESISVMLVLEDGQVAVGDCTAVQYSGAGGRDPLFLAETYIPFLDEHIRPLLEGASVDAFRPLAEMLDTLEVDGRRIHTALRYGLSQAALDAVAKSQNMQKIEVVLNEYQLPFVPKPVPIFAQSGDDRYLCVDKMIIKEADVLPHALINNIDEKLGRNGEKLKEYIVWLKNRIESSDAFPSYHPDLHIDVYGTIGQIFEHDPDRIAAYLAELEKAAGDFALYIEGPVDMGQKSAQIEVMGRIRKSLQEIGCGVKLVADEWCNTYEDVRDFTDSQCCDMVQIKTPDLGSIHNTIESVLYAKQNGMEAYQGGTCNETDVSARTCVHLALATQADRMLAKPGMGFDEGYCIVKNEMNRVLSVLRHKRGKNLNIPEVMNG